MVSLSDGPLSLVRLQCGFGFIVLSYERLYNTLYHCKSCLTSRRIIGAMTQHAVRLLLQALLASGRWEAEQEASREQRFGRSHFAQHHFGGDTSGVQRCVLCLGVSCFKPRGAFILQSRGYAVAPKYTCWADKADSTAVAQYIDTVGAILWQQTRCVKHEGLWSQSICACAKATPKVKFANVLHWGYDRLFCSQRFHAPPPSTLPLPFPTLPCPPYLVVLPSFAESP